MDFSLNFTPRIHQSIKIAKSLASSLHHNHITALHLFYGVLRVQETFLHYFSQDKFGLIDLHDFLKKQIDPEPLPKNSEVYFSKDFKQSLKSAVKIANLYDHDYIGIEHLLIPLLKTKEVINFCSQYNIYSNDISKEVEKAFKGSIDSHNFDIEHTQRDKIKHQINKYVTPTPDDSISHKNNPHELHIDSLPFCENFEIFARKGQFRNLLFDESKPQEVIEILSRKSKNNPLIIGDPGIGKTALIEYLSQIIYDKKVPDFLIGKKIISLNLGGLVAGTKYRGQFEERLKDLIKLLSNNSSYILFIDEMHSLCGIGQAEGGMDAANLLKPALSRGDITCIGATTYKEYQTYLSKDSALCRRFQNVALNEPPQGLCVKMLNSIMLDYEDYHHIKFRKNAIQSAVKLSSRYIHDRHLPDKAIDLLDECAAKIK
jgi:ATP-dependent Clp protease ATP-binding subunit ClpA